MFKEKAKKFYEKHKTTIIIVGGGVLLGVSAILLLDNKKSDVNIAEPKWMPLQPSDEDKKLAEQYGGVFENDSEVAFVTKEMATKFMEDQGDTYQIDKLDEDTSVIWISNTGSIQGSHLTRVD